MLGRLPEAALLLILSYSTIADVRSLCLCSRRLNVLAKDDSVWISKLKLLDFDLSGTRSQSSTNGSASVQAGSTPEQSKENARRSVDAQKGAKPKKKQDVLFSTTEDDFGDFVTTSHSQGSAELFGQSAIKANDLLSFDDEGGQDIGTNSFRVAASSSKTVAKEAPNGADEPPRVTFIKAYATLVPYYLSLQIHTTSSSIFTQISLTPLNRARLLATLTRLLLQPLSPTRSASTLNIYKRNLESAIDFFEGALLAEFEKADIRNDIEAMKKCATIAWEIPSTSSTSHSSTVTHSLNGASNKNIVQVFVNRREIFYDQSHNPLKNLVKVASPEVGKEGELVDGIDFAAMDKYMGFVLDVVKKEGETIAKVFPKESGVLLDFAERIAVDVVCSFVGWFYYLM